MEVETQTDAVIEGRKFSLQLLFSERNHYCMVCQVSGDCELQTLAYEHGLDHWAYPRSFKKMAVDASHPYIIMEPNRCVLCTRCVRACAQIAANHTLGLRERGSETMICADLAVPLGESSCVSCGACLQVCPTGALIDAKSAYGGHEEDLDHTQTTCMQCSVGCTLDVVSRDGRLLRVDGVFDAKPGGGLLCVDGRFKPLYEERERLTKPLVRREGKLKEVTWDEALSLTAKRLSGGSVLGLANCATTDEALAAFAGLVDEVDGEAGRLEPAAPALGFGKSAQLDDILAADFIIVAGADPLNFQRVVGYLIKRAADQGTPVALIGAAENGLRDHACLTVPYGRAGKVVEAASEAAHPLVVYSVGLKAQVVKALEPLAEKIRFLALDPARNGKGAEAAGLAPRAVKDVDVAYFLLGEQSEENGLVDQLDGAFTIVQASYRSPLVERADVVLPAPIWAERTGHTTNVEGSKLPVNAAVPMPKGVRDDVEVLTALVDLIR
jgi:formate dehydrogenase major subunit